MQHVERKKPNEKTKRPPEYRQSGCLIVTRPSDGAVLLVKKPRSRHAWQFPQGGVEAGEGYMEAALREFREEIGTDKVRMLSLEPEAVFKYDYPKNAEFPAHVTDPFRYAGQEVYMFLGEFLGEDSDIKLQESELETYLWVRKDALFEYLEDKRYLKLAQGILNATNRSST